MFSVVRSPLRWLMIVGAAVATVAVGSVQPAATQSLSWVQVGADIDGVAASESSGSAVSVSADGSTVAVGAFLNSGNGSFAGAVRVYRLVGSSWVQLGDAVLGEAAGDWFGYSVALSADGTRLAAGAVFNGGNGVDAGHVRVFELVGSSWVQLGGDIDGEAAGDQAGESIALSANGSRVVVGANLNDGGGSNAGSVRVFDLVSGSWVQVGGDIDGEAAGDRSGHAVSVSADGSRVAVGANLNGGGGSAAGQVRVFDLVSGSWVQVGGDLDGLDGGNQFGFSVALSADGARLAVGAPPRNGGTGEVRVFEFDGTNWVSVGGAIAGAAPGDSGGHAVALSADGSRVAVGSPYAAGAGDDAGHVRVFDLVVASWVQVGADIDGEAAFNQAGRTVAMTPDGVRVVVGAPINSSSVGHVRVFELTLPEQPPVVPPAYTG